MNLGQNTLLSPKTIEELIIYPSSDPNLELISESEFTTRWDFINDTATESVLYSEYFDNTTQGVYDLHNVNERTLNISTIQPTRGYILRTSSDNGVNWDTEYYPSSNYKYIKNGTTGPTHLLQEFSVVLNNQYLLNNYTENTFVNFFAIETQGNLWLDIRYANTDNVNDILNSIYLDERNIIPMGTIEEWDALYGEDLGDGVLYLHMYNAYNFSIIPYSILIFNVSSSSTQSSGRVEGDLWNSMNSGYTDYANYTFFYFDARMRVSNYLTKNYHGTGFAYLQTNTEETLALRSPNNLTLNLQESDKLRITYNTSSANQIKLNLLNSGIEAKSFTLSPQGNTNFNTQSKSFSIGADLYSDQIELSGLFAESKNIIIESIEIIRETPEFTVYVNPYGLRQLTLTPGANYSINVYEKNVLSFSVDITITSSLQVIIYEGLNTNQVYINLYNANNDWLNFYDFTVYVNYTYNKREYYNQRLTVNTLRVDMETTIYFRIFDSFDSMVKAYSTIEQTFIDITLNVFSLKIKNECSKNVEFNLTKDGSVKMGLLYPAEIIEFIINIGEYILNWVNYENNDYDTLNISLTSNKLITLNTTYRQVYFSIFNFDGLGLNKDLVRFYINSTRREFGFNTIESRHAHLVVLDYFNATLTDSVVDLENYTEYNIYVEIWNLIIFNNYSHEIIMEIERNGITVKQLIPGKAGVNYRFLPNVNYSIIIRDLNDIILDNETITLDENNKIVSFGFYAAMVPEDPVPEEDPAIIERETIVIGPVLTAILLTGAIVLCVIIILAIYNREKKPRRDKKVDPYPNGLYTKPQRPKQKKRKR